MSQREKYIFVIEAAYSSCAKGTKSGVIVHIVTLFIQYHWLFLVELKCLEVSGHDFPLYIVSYAPDNASLRSHYIEIEDIGLGNNFDVFYFNILW